MAPTAHNALHRSAETRAGGQQRVRSERKRKKRTKGGIPPLQSRVASGNSKQVFFQCLTGFLFLFFFFSTETVKVLVLKKRDSTKTPGFKFRSLRKTHCRWLKTSGVRSQGIPPSPDFLTATVPLSALPTPPVQQLCNTETVPKRPERVCSPWQSPESEVDGRNFPEITVSISRLQTSQRRRWWYGSGGKVVSECFCNKLLCYNCCNPRDSTVAD